MKLFTRTILILSLVLLLFSCSKNKRVENKLEGVWKVTSAVDASGNLSPTDLIGMEIEFERCDGSDKCYGVFKNFITESCMECIYNSGGFEYTTGEFCGNYSDIIEVKEIYENYGYVCSYTNGIGSNGNSYTYFEYESKNKGKELELSFYSEDGMIIWFGQIEKLSKKKLMIEFYTTYGEYLKFEFEKN